MNKFFIFLLIFCIYLNLSLLALLGMRIGPGETELHIAAADGTSSEIEELISLGRDPNVKTQFNRTPLAYAVMGKNIETLKVLINFGANPNEADSIGGTPLHNACDIGFYDAIVYLTDHGANLNIQDRYGKTPLSVVLSSGCFQFDIIEFLLSKGCDIGDHDQFLLFLNNYDEDFISRLMSHIYDDGNTILHLAAKFGALNLVSFLLKFVDDYFIKNSLNEAAHDLAFNSGYFVLAYKLGPSDPFHACNLM